jgi:hypothetical protein
MQNAKFRASTSGRLRKISSVPTFFLKTKVLDCLICSLRAFRDVFCQQKDEIVFCKMRRFTKIAKRNKLTMGKSLFSMAVIYSASFHYYYLNETVKPTKIVYSEGRASILSVRRVSSLKPKQRSIENTANTSHQMIQQQTENQPGQAKQLYIHVFLQHRSETFIHLLNNITNADYKVLQT